MKKLFLFLISLLLSVAPVNARTLITGYDTNNHYQPVQVEAGKYYPGISLYPEEQKFGVSVLLPVQGGTGTGTIPTSGQMLVGNSNGKYDLTNTVPSLIATTITTTYVNALTSSGLTLRANNNSNVALFGAGGGQAVTFYDGGTFTGNLAVGNAAHGDSRLEVKGTTADGSTGIMHGYDSNDVEQFTLQTNGYLGLGTTTPRYKFAVASTTDGAIFGVDDINKSIYYSNTGEFETSFNSNGSTVNSQVSLVSNGTSRLTYSAHSNTGAFSGIMNFLKSRGTQDVPTAIQSGDSIGSLTFSGYKDATTGYSAAAAIIPKVKGTVSSTSMPGEINFYTTSEGAVSSQFRMTISPTGYIGIATSTPTGMLAINTPDYDTPFLRLLDPLNYTGLTFASSSVSLNSLNNGVISSVMTFPGFALDIGDNIGNLGGVVRIHGPFGGAGVQVMGSSDTITAELTGDHLLVGGSNTSTMNGQYLSVGQQSSHPNGTFTVSGNDGSVSASGSAKFYQGLTVGFATSTSQINNIKTVTSSIDFGIVAGNSCSEVTSTFAGASPGSPVFHSLTTPLAAEGSLTFTAFISASDVVTLRGCNASASATADPAATEIRFVSFDMF